MTLAIKARIASAIAVTVLMAATAIPVSAAGEPLLDVSNPAPNSYLRRGGHFFSGVACDPASTGSNAGIAKVTAFIGDRDSTQGAIWWRPGGYIAAATGNVGNSQIGMQTTGGPCKQADAGWRIRTTSLRKGKYSLYVYALSTSGKETVSIIPIRVDIP
jgi:hypothetical protein